MAKFSADVGSWSEFEYGAVPIGPAAVDRPVQVSFLVEDQPGIGIRPVGAGIALSTKAIEDSFFVLGSELKYDAAARVSLAFIIGPTVERRPIQVPLQVEGQPGIGILPIGAATLRTEAIEDRLFAFGSELEYGPVSVGPAVVGRPIQVLLLIEDHACIGLCPIGAVGLRAKAVEHGLLPIWREFEYYATAGVAVAFRVGPAKEGGAVQVPLQVEDQPRIGILPIGAAPLRTEAVDDCLLAFWCELEYDSGSVGPANGRRPIQVSLSVEDQSCCGTVYLPLGVSLNTAPAP